MHDLPPVSSNEITQEQIEVFVQKVRDVAPYTNEYIDDFGSYRVDYESGSFGVAIYVPIAAGSIDTSEDDSSFVSDSLSVIVREETPTDDEQYSLVHTRQYTVHLEDNSTNYDEQSRIYDTHNNKWAATLFPKGAVSDIQMLQDYVATKTALGLSVFSEERLNDVCAILDDLRPEQKV